MTDPFARLGLSANASADEVRAARRRLAKDHHPDAGGAADDMVDVNRAALAALAALEEAGGAASSGAPAGDSGVCSGADLAQTPEWTQTPDASGRWATDMPSFTVEALPAETFEALVVVAGWIGEVLDDDPPYRLDVALQEPAVCWCRLDVVPDAGSSTISLTVGPIVGSREDAMPDVERVRDTWIAHLNQLDWA